MINFKIHSKICKRHHCLSIKKDPSLVRNIFRLAVHQTLNWYFTYPYERYIYLHHNQKIIMVSSVQAKSIVFANTPLKSMSVLKPKLFYIV